MFIMYDANASRYWPTNATFADAMRGSFRAAQDLDPSHDWGHQVARAWGAVKVCDCPHQGDIVQNNFIDVQDVLQTISVAFTNGQDVLDSQCLTTRCDVDHSGFVDVGDVMRIIQTALNNGPNPLNPCAP